MAGGTAARILSLPIMGHRRAPVPGRHPPHRWTGCGFARREQLVDNPWPKTKKPQLLRGITGRVVINQSNLLPNTGH
jgi:hypothetical protein